jgi:hypothetical protein
MSTPDASPSRVNAKRTLAPRVSGSRPYRGAAARLDRYRHESDAIAATDPTTYRRSRTGRLPAARPSGPHSGLRHYGNSGRSVGPWSSSGPPPWPASAGIKPADHPAV